ncbi:MAG: hypothetical protein ACFFAE_12530 [Candidatus Hodarchaeota archaeon]
MEQRKNHEDSSWIFTPSSVFNLDKRNLEYNFWKLTIIRATLQAGLFFFAIFLPWYRLYHPEATEIEVNAFNLGPQVITLLVISFLVSLFEILWLLKQRNQGYTTNIGFNIFYLIPALLIFDLIGNPVFLPGLGGKYSDYISLFTLNFAGYQIFPLVGYLCIITALISVLLGLLLQIFSP